MSRKHRRTASSHPIYKPRRGEHDNLVEERRERIRGAAQKVFDLELKAILGTKQTFRERAEDTGLSTSTIRRYRDREWGARGPLLTTYLALRHRGE